MPFTPKNWVDAAGEAAEASNLNDIEARIEAAVPAFNQRTWTQKTSATPLSAAAIEDLEDRVTDYGFQFLNVKNDFGAVGDGVWNGSTFTGTDDTTAINNALDALQGRTPQHGGILFFPYSSGVYRCTGGLNADGAVGITLLGEGATSDAGLAGFPPSCLAYVGGGSGEFLRCRNSQGFGFEKLGILYTGSFSGTLVDASNQGGSDTQHFWARKSMFAGIATMTARALISWWNAIFCHVDGCHFGQAQNGIRGKEEVGAAVGYSNSMAVRDSSFIRTVSALTNLGDKWTIDGNGFEGLQGGLSDYLHHAVSYDLTNSTGFGMTFTNNWMGDASGTQEWIKANRGGLGGLIAGNTFQGGTGGINANSAGLSPITAPAGPLVVQGNGFSHSSAATNYAVDLGDAADRQFVGFDFTGNNVAIGSPDPALRAGASGSIYDHLALTIGSNRNSNASDTSTRAFFDNRNALRSQASASTVTIDPSTSVVYLSGTTTVTNISAGYGGQRVTLISNGEAKTITDGGNLKMRGNFGPTTYQDNITFVYNTIDSMWHETSRSDE